jgi:hypothetical protein
VRPVRRRLPGRPLVAVAVLAVASAGCGRDGHDVIARSGPSTTEVHDVTDTIPPPGPATSALVASSPALLLPVLPPGRRGVVTWGRVTAGALVAVVRNMALQPLEDAAVVATVKGGSGPAGPPAAVAPSTLKPGEWGVALVVLDRPERGPFAFSLTRAAARRADVTVEAGDAPGGAVAGLVRNVTGQPVGDVVVELVCFARSRPVSMARLRPATRLEPGATAPFSATIRAKPCADWAVVGSGLAE